MWKRAIISNRRLITIGKSTIDREKRHFTPRATLAALGLKIRQLGIFRPIAERVKIAQKAVRYTLPTEGIENRYELLILSFFTRLLCHTKQKLSNKGNRIQQ